VPSTAFSDAKPAQASLRLARRVAQLAGVPLVQALTKNASGGISANTSGKDEPGRRRVALVDDQTTSGQTIETCRHNLTERRSVVVEPMTWSASRLKTVWAIRHHVGTPCWLESLDLPSAAGRLECQSSAS
jgi:hypothetical protein